MDKETLQVLLAYMESDAEGRKKLLAQLTQGVTWGGYVQFTNKETAQMPKNYKKMFREGKLRAYIRERKRGNSVNYEVRCRMDGICIHAGGTTKEEARARFIEKLKAHESGVSSTPTLFGEFLMFYFENFRKREVTPCTYRKDMERVKKHLLPAFGKMRLANITPAACQKFFDGIMGKGKTAEELFSLMSQTFKCAIAHRLLPFSPLDTVMRPAHDRENGSALTREQEAKLLAEVPKERREAFAILLYTGLRPNEYPTIMRDGNMLIAKNSKRKGGKVEYKRIPICPMLRPYITACPVLPTSRTLWNELKRVLPSRTLYDLRTTFHTRCVECGVDDNARKLMMGHSLGRLGNAYTDVSDDFLRTEAAKISYDLPPILPPKNQ